MLYPLEMLTAAHERCRSHRSELQRSELCGCFYCCSTFPYHEIDDWLNEGDGTALCPHCGIDSVIGSASGYPVNDPAFRKAMNGRWFGSGRVV
jgi:hypothetical protein